MAEYTTPPRIPRQNAARLRRLAQAFRAPGSNQPDKGGIADRMLTPEPKQYGTSVDVSLSSYAMAEPVFAVKLITGDTNRQVSLPPAVDYANTVVYIKKADAGTGTITIVGYGESAPSSEEREIQAERLSLNGSGVRQFQVDDVFVQIEPWELTGYQLIDGAAGQTISAAQGALAILSDGTDWHIVGGYSP